MLVNRQNAKMLRRARVFAYVMSRHKEKGRAVPLKNGRKTRQEKAFIMHYVNTTDGHYAAEKAGYGTPRSRSSELLARPAIQEEIARQQTARLFNDLLPLAVNCLQSIMVSERSPAGAKVQAAKIVLDRTLGQDDAMRSKDPSEMTPDELQRAIADLRRAASDKAKEVNAKVVDSAPGGDVFG